MASSFSAESRFNYEQDFSSFKICYEIDNDIPNTLSGYTSGDTVTLYAVKTIDNKNKYFEEDKTFYTDGEDIIFECGVPIPSTWKKVSCEEKEENIKCVESQEWTYGVDNTGTDYRWVDAKYLITLSNGQTLTFSQSSASNGGWAAQLTEWAANIQIAADNAGLKWLAEPRFVDNPNPSNIDGTINGPNGTPSGLAGAPSVPIAEALIGGGIAWRYVNIQVCPNQPVPVGMELISVDNQGAGRTAPSLPYTLTTAGAFLGIINEFKVCEQCGDGSDDIYYIKTGAKEFRLATQGEIPFCEFPCGTLALTESPPDQECKFEIDVACDNNNSVNINDFTNTITRRATICNGEQIAVDYFQADPNDASALIPYILIGDFVDCATGVPIDLPIVDGILLDCSATTVSESYDNDVRIIGSKNPIPVFITDNCCVIPTNIKCIKKRSFEFVYDNGFTAGSSTNDCNARNNFVRFSWDMKSQGWETGTGIIGVGDQIGPYGGWTPQLQGWVAFGNTHDPYDSNHSFDSKAAPTYRSWVVRGCNPEAKYGIWTLRRDDGCEFTMYPVLYTETIEKVWVSSNVDCDGNITTTYYTQNEDGNTYTEIPTPDDIECFVNCDYKFDPTLIEDAVSPCETKEYTLCDRVDPNDSSQDVQFVLVVDNCEGEITRYRYTFDSYNNATSPDDLVEYTVVGDVVVCGTNDLFVEPLPDCGDFEIATLYSRENITGTLRNREWDLGPRETNNQTVEFANSVLDNFDESSATSFESDLTTLGVNDTNNSSTIMDVQIVDGYVVVEKPIKLRWTGTSLGYFKLEVGECCGELVTKIEGASGDGTANPTESYTFPIGFHKIKMTNLDDYTNTSRNVQYSIDGGDTWVTDNTPPFIELSKIKPIEKCKQVKICKDSELIIGLLDGKIIDVDNCYECPISCNVDSETQEIIYEPTTQCYKVEASTEEIQGDNTATWVIIEGELEINNVGGNQNGAGPFVNTITGNRLQYSVDGGLTYGQWQNTLGGGGTGRVINTDPVYIRDGATGTPVLIDITAFSGGGSTNYNAVAFIESPEEIYTCKTYTDGNVVCTDNLGNKVDVPDNAVQFICPPEKVEVTNKIEVSNCNDVVEKKCFVRDSIFFDNVVGIDTGGRPLTDNIEVTTNESGPLTLIRLRVDNVGPANGPKPTISFFIDGQPMTIISNNNSTPPTFPVDSANPAINTYEIQPPTGFNVIAGQTYVVSATLDGGNNPNVQWQQNAQNSDNQVEFTGVQNGNYPAIEWITEGQDIFCEETKADGSTVFKDNLGCVIDSLPFGLDPINCDLICNEKCNQDLAERIATEIENLEPTYESLSEVEICIEGKTAILKTIMLTDGTEFIEYRDETGVLNTPASFTFGKCHHEVFDYYETTEITGTLRNREWHDSQPALPTTNSTTEDGRNFRENHDFSLPTTTDTSVTTLALNDTNNTASRLDIQVIEGYITLNSPLDLRYIGASEGYWAVELGKCCEELELIAENGGFSPDRNMPFTLPKGTHRIRLWNIDSGGSNSSANLQYSTDGGITYITDNTPPNLLFSETKPEEICKQGYLCEGVYFELDKTTPVVFSDTVSLCKTECVQSVNSSNDGGGTASNVTVDNFPDQCPEMDVTLTVQTGTGNIPAGFKSVTINNINGITTINGGFELGTGRRVDSISFGTDRSNCTNELLPAYTLSGGTWQWIGHRE